MKGSGIRYVVILLVILLVMAIAISGVGGRKNIIPTSGNEGTTGNREQTITPLVNQTIIYGQWFDSGTKIYAYNLSTAERGIIASLPLDIKKVSVLPNEELLYIADVNLDTDHGKNLSVYSITDKKSHVLYKSSDGYGIDDYVISPNKRYIASWEVVFLPGTAVLTGGASRVRVIDRGNNGNAITFFDELQSGNTPVHYPVAVTDTGQVYADSFLPNSGTGWSHGMSVAIFNGAVERELDNMRNGMYGTQPALSPDGKYLAFAGYVGSDGTVEKDGFRTAILMPNTVELLTVDGNKREVIALQENGIIYSGVAWDSLTGKLLYTKIATKEKEQENGLYVYDLQSKQSKKIVIPIDGTTSFVGFSEADKFMLGTQDTSATALGNLGAKYAAAFTSFSIVDGGKITQVSNLGGLMQFIDTVPSWYIGGHVLADQSANPTDCSGYKNLQLCPFYLKPSLAVKREDQQSQPPKTTIPTTPLPICRELEARVCGELGYTAGTSDFIECTYQQELHLASTGQCQDSPLYLYGAEGQKVSIKVQTVVHESNAPYNGEYAVTLGKAGKIYIGGNLYASIAYGYTPGLKRLPVPSYGKVVRKDEVGVILKEYAAGLGLNEQETADLVSFGARVVTSSYAFLSFYDQKTSEKILPLAFNPTPDTYQNIVFYIKKLEAQPEREVPAPVFPPIRLRVGMTAIEISEIVE